MVWITKADEFYTNKDFQNALIHYKMVMNDTIAKNDKIIPYEIQISNRSLSKKAKEANDGRTVTLEEYVNHQIGMCYQHTFDYQKAEEQFSKTYQSKGYPDDAYYYGSALKNNQKYQEALSIFNNFVQSGSSNDSLIEKSKTSMVGCYYALKDSLVKTEAIVALADTIFNAGTSSFATAYFGSENRLMFTSARANGVILKPEQQSEFLCDVYWREKDENGDWKDAVNFGRPMNSAQHDAASSVKNGNVIYYTRWSDENRKVQSIYMARMMNFKFFEAYKLDERVNVEGYASMQPFISLDGKEMFFSSNRPGGKGGFDIWKIAIDSLGNITGEPENIGEPVNSPDDETTPFFHQASSTLFFSSNGHNSIGGFDLFKSNFIIDYQKYEAPSNLGEPINSSFDDTYLIWDSKLETGYMSSDREPCENGHCYKIYEVSNAPIIVRLEGYVYDKNTNEVIKDAKIIVKDVKGLKNEYQVLSDEKGYYSMDIKIGQEIFLKAQKDGYFADAGVINTEEITESATLTQDFYLDKIKKGEIELEGIEYDYDSDKLRPASLLVLDKLYDILELNDNLIVDINSHTDCRGSDAYNLKLSQRRAQSCVNYLISKGIDSKRLVAHGYGETQPTKYMSEDRKPILDKNGKEIKLTEQFIKTVKSKDEQERLHQLNRRTAFKVVGDNFNLKSSD